MSPSVQTEASTRREKLDVRFAPSIVDKLMEDTKSRQTNRRPQTSKLPESSVLAHLRTFLPQMQSANEMLSRHPASEPAVMISDMQEEPAELEQDTEDGMLQHIQMDIACGVVDLKDAAALQAAEDAINGVGTDAVTGSSSDSDSNNESDSNSDANSCHDSDVQQPVAPATPAADPSEQHKLASGHRNLQAANTCSSALQPPTSGKAKQRQPKILEI
ncbi:hypothetical protein WJX77_002663 [Trebouxia sp. C0004]